MVEEILDFLGNLGEGEDDDKKKRKKHGKHDEEEDDEEFSAASVFKKISRNKGLLIGLIIGGIILLGLIIWLIVAFWPQISLLLKSSGN